MASFSYSFALVVAVGFLFALSSPADAKTCSSQTFADKNYTNCVDLPYLSAYLHWTYDESNSSLSIAFIAPPAESDGWVAWAINPTGTGMVGSQAFVALTLNGTVIIRTYNISSYSSVVPSELSFDVWDLGVDHSNGNYTIFATAKVPEMAKFVNQVWQVGPKVNQENGRILQHSISSDNLSSKGILNLAATDSPTLGPSLSPPPSTGFPNASPPPLNGGQRIRAMTVSFTGVYMLLAALLVVF